MQIPWPDISIIHSETISQSSTMAVLGSLLEEPKCAVQKIKMAVTLLAMTTTSVSHPQLFVAMYTGTTAACPKGWCTEQRQRARRRVLDLQSQRGRDGGQAGKGGWLVLWFLYTGSTGVGCEA